MILEVITKPRKHLKAWRGSRAGRGIGEGAGDRHPGESRSPGAWAGFLLPVFTGTSFAGTTGQKGPPRILFPELISFATTSHVFDYLGSGCSDNLLIVPAEHGSPLPADSEQKRAAAA